MFLQTSKFYPQRDLESIGNMDINPDGQPSENFVTDEFNQSFPLTATKKRIPDNDMDKRGHASLDLFFGWNGIYDNSSTQWEGLETPESSHSLSSVRKHLLIF